MTISVSRSSVKTLVDAGGTTLTCSFGTLPTVGTSVIAQICTTTSTVTSVGDNQGHATYTLDKKETDNISGQTIAIFRLPVIATSAGTFTCTFTIGSGAYSLAIISQTSVAVLVDGATTTNGVHGASAGGLNETIAFTTSSNTDSDLICFASCTVDGSSTNEGVTTATIDGSLGTNLTNEQNASLHVVGSHDYRALSTSGTKAISWTIADHYANKAGCAVVYKNASAPTGSPLIFPRRMSGGMYDMSRGM